MILFLFFFTLSARYRTLADPHKIIRFQGGHTSKKTHSSRAFSPFSLCILCKDPSSLQLNSLTRPAGVTVVFREVRQITFSKLLHFLCSVWHTHTYTNTHTHSRPQCGISPHMKLLIIQKANLFCTYCIYSLICNSPWMNKRHICSPRYFPVMVRRGGGGFRVVLDGVAGVISLLVMSKLECVEESRCFVMFFFLLLLLFLFLCWNQIELVWKGLDSHF